ncbi:hypothetical protein E9993_19475 [Labilibacter sediminis]|nr:hypothetical protein E9993_19475 [Labilibacter sediminis]
MGEGIKKYSTLSLNGVCRSGEALQNFCMQEIAKTTTPEWQKHIYQFVEEWLSPLDYIVAQTSGSTGEPKKIKLKKEHMIASAKKTIRYFNLQPDQTALLCLSANYIAGKMMIVRAFVGGFDLKLVEPGGYPLRDITTQIDFAAMVPLQVSNSIQEVEAWRTVKTVIIGGGAVSDELKSSLVDLDTGFYETYGMTETVSHVAVRKIGEDDRFKPMPNVSFDVDERNCLVIQAPDISSTPVVTNDIVDVDACGHLLLQGRYDNVINSGGVKISPEQVERKLSKCIEAFFVISSVQDDKLGEMLVLVVEEGVDLSQVKKQIKDIQSLNKYEKPKRILQVKNIPLTPTSKIMRNELRQMIARGEAK